MWSNLGCEGGVEKGASEGKEGNGNCKGTICSRVAAIYIYIYCNVTTAIYCAVLIISQLISRRAFTGFYSNNGY